MSADSGYFESEDWEEEEEEPLRASAPAEPLKAKMIKEEPMSPVVVLLYVGFFYLVWQILTRVDDGEIFGPQLPFSRGPSPSHDQPRMGAPQQQYQFPYTLQPQSPGPAAATNAESASAWRIAFSTLLYPIYIAITLIAIPLPFLMNAFRLVGSVLSTILYPITSTMRLLARTFVIAPLSVVAGFLQSLYPVYVFVGGVVGAGAFLGVAFGWFGRVLVNMVLRPRSAPRRRKSRKSRSKRASSHSQHTNPLTADPITATSPVAEAAPIASSRPKRYSLPAEDTEYAPIRPSLVRSRPNSGIFEPNVVRPRPTSASFEPVRSRPTSASFEPVRSRPTSGSFERRYVPIVDLIEIEDQYLPYEQAHTSARDGVVLGVRRRGVRV